MLADTGWTVRTCRGCHSFSPPTSRRLVARCDLSSTGGRALVRHGRLGFTFCLAANAFWTDRCVV